jgi:hypothetical protein
MSRNLLGSIFHTVGEKKPVPLLRLRLSLARRHGSSERIGQAVGEICDLLTAGYMADGAMSDVVDRT